MASAFVSSECHLRHCFNQVKVKVKTDRRLSCRMLLDDKDLRSIATVGKQYQEHLACIRLPTFSPCCLQAGMG